MAKVFYTGLDDIDLFGRCIVLLSMENLNLLIHATNLIFYASTFIFIIPSISVSSPSRVVRLLGYLLSHFCTPHF